ncbi:MAG: prepilin-type N-terminal cleavage/methylation domain-containing protein [Bdellovibrionales bacterium]|nr:prepilin-type N-terminal cleavage/methylation domain-containing protein [Bdellovibrionales bacterium]
MKSIGGYTLIELLVAMSLAGILSGIATVNFVEMSNPSLSAASNISTYLKQARARALATTSAYTLTATNTETIVATYGSTCSAVQTPDPELTLQLEKASLTSISWTICFNSRGFPDSNVIIPVVDIYSSQNTVEVLLGGAIRIQ